MDSPGATLEIRLTDFHSVLTRKTGDCVSSPNILGLFIRSGVANFGKSNIEELWAAYECEGIGDPGQALLLVHQPA